MSVHFLKCWPVFFQLAWDNVKPFESRNNDRGFEVGDRVNLQEFDPNNGQFTGRWLDGVIRYKTEMGMQPGWCAFAWEEEARGENQKLEFEKTEKEDK